MQTVMKRVPADLSYIHSAMAAFENQVGTVTLLFVCLVFQLLQPGLPPWFKLFKSGLRLAFLACFHARIYSLFSCLLAALLYS